MHKDGQLVDIVLQTNQMGKLKTFSYVFDFEFQWTSHHCIWANRHRPCKVILNIKQLQHIDCSSLFSFVGQLNTILTNAIIFV